MNTAMVPLMAATLLVVVARSRVLIFTGATRNSLALPDVYAITPVIVVTQTLVELVAWSSTSARFPAWLPTVRNRRTTRTDPRSAANDRRGPHAPLRWHVSEVTAGTAELA